MTAPLLSRASGAAPAAAPVRIVHLGLGNFFRAHQAWYTGRAPDADAWGIAAFGGRGRRLAGSLAAQDGLYTLVTKGRDEDRFEIVGSVSRAHGADDHVAWLGYLRDPEVRIVTITITEAGYLRAAGGGLDRDRPEVVAEVELLHADRAAPVRTPLARLVAGLAARRQADVGGLTLLPCDNLPGNGRIAAGVVRDLAELVDPELAAWVEQSLATVTTVVDRITPRPTAEDERLVHAATGVTDRCPVATEPFSEWVLCGEFAGPRPRWEDAGAILTDDIDPFEERKLWLLNGGHSLLAYAGSAGGHETVAEAVADDRCRSALERWWSEASAHLAQSAEAVAEYRAALLSRFANPRIRHRLEQIAADGSQKLPIRILPILRRERAAGRVPEGATLVLAAWIDHLRGSGAPVSDVRAAELVPLAAGSLAEAVPRVLRALDPALGDDLAVTATVLEQSRELEGRQPRSQEVR